MSHRNAELDKIYSTEDKSKIYKVIQDLQRISRRNVEFYKINKNLVAERHSCTRFMEDESQKC